MKKYSILSLFPQVRTVHSRFSLNENNGAPRVPGGSQRSVIYNNNKGSNKVRELAIMGEGEGDIQSILGIFIQGVNIGHLS